MRLRAVRPTILLLGLLGLGTFGGGLAVGATALAAKAPTSATACLGTKGALLLAPNGVCAKGLSTVHLPLSTTKGARGATGAQGQIGATGAQGAQGTQGIQGAQGVPGPLSTTLPSGVTERGTFEVSQAVAASTFVHGTLSYPFQLSSAPTIVEVPPSGPSPDPTHCAGSLASPSASAGYLCLYMNNEQDSAPVSSWIIEPRNPGTNQIGAGTLGVLLTTNSVVTGIVDVSGSWAATAP